MSLRGSIYRYGLIYKKLLQKPYSTFEEIRAYIEHQLSFIQMDDEDDDLSIGLSLRTFQREIKNMNRLYGIRIEYSRKKKGYYIEQTIYDTSNFDRMMDAFDVFNSLNIAQDISPYLLVENRKNQGFEHLYALIHAIKHNHTIHIDYQKFGENSPIERIVNPYAIKEFKNRWYLVALDHKDDIMKVFALDRIKNIEKTNQSFSRPTQYEILKRFENVFGIIHLDEDPEEVILSMNQVQAQYLKTLPLHASQKVLKEDGTTCHLQLHVQITKDFIMELLSYGADITVVSPQHLRNTIIDIFQKGLKNYQ